MRVCDFVAQKLASVGIDTVFLVQGAAVNDLIYAIADRKDIRYVCPFHEQAAGFMAEGYAKVRGVPGVAIGTSGPGGQNLTTPICNFFYDSVPGIFLTGQVNSKFMRKSWKQRQVGFQEWPVAAVAHHFTKFSACVMNPESIRYLLEQALYTCQEGRPGPCLLDIPLDVQRTEIGDPEKLEAYQPSVHKRDEDLLYRQVTDFIADFTKAQRPVMIIGGGVRGKALEWMDACAEYLKIPIFPTWNARDRVPYDHPWYGGNIGTYGGPGRNFGVQNSDLLLAVGCRLSGRITGGKPETFARAAKRYTVDVDKHLLDPALQELPFHVNIWADAEEFFNYLERALRYATITDEKFSKVDHRKWWEQCKSWRDKYDPINEFPGIYSISKSEGVYPYLFARKLSELAPENAIIVGDCGGNIVVMNHAFRVKKGQTFITNNGNSPMGFSFCGALGAWFADPSRPVICVIGDGGFNMNIQELQTMKNHGCNVKTFILDNRVYGITRGFQRKAYGERYEASCAPHYIPPDFSNIVSGYDLPSFIMKYSEYVEKDLHNVLDRLGSIICVVECPDFDTYYPKIDGWNTPIEDMSPRLPREEFRANMLIDPMPGWETGEYK